MNRFITLFIFALLAAVPAAEGQWEQITGLYGSYQGFHATNSELYSYDDDGIFRSTDRGQTWRYVLNYRITEGMNLFVSEGAIRLFSNAAIWRSTDSGVTWKEPINNVPNVNSMLLFDGKIFAGSYNGGIYLSIDSGANWNEMSNELDSFSVNALCVSGSTLYALSNFGLWRSSDTGVSWTNLSPPYYIPEYDSLLHKEIFIETDSVRSDQSTRMVVLGSHILYYDSYSYSIYQSSDSGKTWKVITQIPGYVGAGGPYSIGSKIFIITVNGVFCSSDSGTTWSQLDNFPNGAIEGSDSALYVRTESGLFVSIDSGKTWNPIVWSASINSIIMRADTLYAGTGNGTFRSTDNGSSWSRMGQQPIKLFGAIQSILIGCTTEIEVDSLCYSTNSGITWTSAYPGYSASIVDCLAAVDSKLFIAAGGGGILTSLDSGKTWTPLSQSPDSIVYCLSTDGNYLIAGGYRGIYLSEDQGVSWKPITNTLPDSTGTQYASIVSDGNVLAALFNCFGTPNGIPTISYALFVTSDLGLTWNKVNINTSDYPDALYLSGSNIFVGSEYGGIQLSSDIGASWSNSDTGFWNASGELISAFATNSKYIFALSDPESIWRRPLSDFGISSVLPQPVIQENISSYPNPFSTHTQISFTASESGYAEINIVNALGSEVARLYSGALDAGNHSFTFDGTSLAPGNYWCVVRMGGSVERIALSVER